MEHDLASGLPDRKMPDITITVDAAAFPVVGVQRLSIIDNTWATEIEIEADCLEYVHFDQFSKVELRISFPEGVERKWRAIRCQRVSVGKLHIEGVEPKRWPCVDE